MNNHIQEEFIMAAASIIRMPCPEAEILDVLLTVHERHFRTNVLSKILQTVNLNTASSSLVKIQRVILDMRYDQRPEKSAMLLGSVSFTEL
jgi:hypothetical protein